MPRFAEELILLLLDNDGKFAAVPNLSLSFALAGGVLMDLALENRIDTDLEKLVLVDDTPVGDALLDETLAEIAADGGRDARFWVEQTAARGEVIRERVLASLVAQGVLEVRDVRVLWLFRSQRYLARDVAAKNAVKLRIMEVLFSDEIPDPRDVVTICLADTCGIFKQLLSKRELDQASARIDQVRQLDLIGQAVSGAMRDIELSLAAALHPYV
jgi:hypothetical protein